MRLVFTLLALTTLCGCPSGNPVECRDQTSCDLGGGGVCIAASTGNQWCAYPDSNCPGGLRFSDYQIGDGLSGQCVEPTDVVDAGQDDGGIDGLPGVDGPDAANPVGWALDIRGQYTEYVTDVATDPSGNIYITGAFAGTTTFGTMSVTSTGNPTTGISDVFVVKVSPFGTVEWAKRIGSTLYDEGLRVVADAGGVTVGGTFQGTVFFGTGIGTDRTSAGSRDAFILRLNTLGQFVWVAPGGGTGADTLAGLAVDGSGNTYATGSFRTSAAFGGPSLTSLGTDDIWVAKYNPTGVHQWSKSIGSATSESAGGVAVVEGDVVVGGAFADQIDLGGASPFMADGGTDLFVVRLMSSNGSHVWSQRQGGTSADQLRRLVPSTNGVIAIGCHQGTASFGGASFTSAGADDAFVWKMSASGAHVWSIAFGGGDTDCATAALETAGQDVIVGGDYRGGGVSIGGTVLPMLGNIDSFIAKLGLDGAPLSATGHGGTYPDSVAGIALSDGDVVVGGTYYGTVSYFGRMLTSMGDVGENDALLVRE